MPFLVSSSPDPVTSINDLLLMDGRRTAMPTGVFDQVQPHGLSISMVRVVVSRFQRTGRSCGHSGLRHTLPFLIAFCEENRISYTLSANFGKRGVRSGYAITRTDDRSEEDA